MTRRFPLFDSHLDFAYHWWQQHLSPGDTVIDATCGNGHDTLKLAKLVLTSAEGRLVAIDIQQEALKNSQTKLKEAFDDEIYNRIEWIHGSHANFPENTENVYLIVYNLGYLPGGDKNHTTQTPTTLKSVQNGQKLLKNGGIITITCYPGHPEGAKEEKALLEQLRALPPGQWSFSLHQWPNRHLSPSVLIIKKTTPLDY